MCPWKNSKSRQNLYLPIFIVCILDIITNDFCIIYFMYKIQHKDRRIVFFWRTIIWDMYLIQEKTLILDVFSSVHINILCVTFDVSFYAWLHFPFFFRMMKKGLRRKTSVCLINGYQTNIVHASRCKKQSNYTI